MSAALIFGLLFALMLTGMPISISLGLTVLTFLFTMTEVPIESVGLKLFSGPRQFRHHGDPVLHPGRHLPDPRRRGAADDRFHDLAGRSSAGRTWALPASRPARCSRRFPAPASRPWSRSARS